MAGAAMITGCDTGSCVTVATISTGAAAIITGTSTIGAVITNGTSTTGAAMITGVDTGSDYTCTAAFAHGFILLPDGLVSLRPSAHLI